MSLFSTADTGHLVLVGVVFQDCYFSRMTGSGCFCSCPEDGNSGNSVVLNSVDFAAIISWDGSGLQHPLHHPAPLAEQPEFCVWFCFFLGMELDHGQSDGNVQIQGLHRLQVDDWP